jgi:hypothetical protein
MSGEPATRWLASAISGTADVLQAGNDQRPRGLAGGRDNASAIFHNPPSATPTFENQSFRASGLGLNAVAIAHWNSVYLTVPCGGLRSFNASVVIGWQHREARILSQMKQEDAPRPSQGQAPNTQMATA